MCGEFNDGEIALANGPFQLVVAHSSWGRPADRWVPGVSHTRRGLSDSVLVLDTRAGWCSVWSSHGRGRSGRVRNRGRGGRSNSSSAWHGRHLLSARSRSLSLCGKRLRSSVAAARDTKHAPSVRHWAACLRPHRASLHTNPTSLRKHPLEDVAPATVSVNDDFIPFLPYNYSATPRAWIPVAMATEVKLRVRVGGK